jgi:hypothetical protein
MNTDRQQFAALAAAPAPDPEPTLDLAAWRELVAALEDHAEDRPLPRGMDRWDLLDLARRVRR